MVNTAKIGIIYLQAFNFLQAFSDGDFVGIVYKCILIKDKGIIYKKF